MDPASSPSSPDVGGAALQDREPLGEDLGPFEAPNEANAVVVLISRQAARQRSLSDQLREFRQKPDRETAIKLVRTSIVICMDESGTAEPVTFPTENPPASQLPEEHSFIHEARRYTFLRDDFPEYTMLLEMRDGSRTLPLSEELMGLVVQRAESARRILAGN